MYSEDEQVGVSINLVPTGLVLEYDEYEFLKLQLTKSMERCYCVMMERKTTAMVITAIVPVFAIASTSLSIAASDTVCSGNPHDFDSGPNGNPHDPENGNLENGNPHDGQEGDHHGFHHPEDNFCAGAT
jgi:hypothetical protein